MLRFVGGPLTLPRAVAISFGILAIGVGVGGCEGETLGLGSLDDPTGGTSGEPPADADGGGVGGLAGQGGGSGCTPPAPSAHFDFAGTGTSVPDLRGGPAAAILGGATLDGAGALFLDGVDDYVALAATPWTGSRVTLALWLRYRGLAAYQRLLDFGSNTELDPVAGTIGTSYLALTPTTGYFPTGLAVLLSNSGSANEVAAVTDTVLSTDDEFLVVVVDEQSLASFRAGALLTRVPHAVDVGQLAPVNRWLGRSQYEQDPYAEVTYLDFRVYDDALEDCQIAALYAQGLPASP
ncbi:MAG TPA: LamG-like jellyroll fold domain-containing protein [Polyangiaceae bacterium]|nr:LamG-like jellyroll fold domain-containing protein [Polyangiaceae bacterium]